MTKGKSTEIGPFANLSDRVEDLTQLRRVPWHHIVQEALRNGREFYIRVETRGAEQEDFVFEKVPSEIVLKALNSRSESLVQFGVRGNILDLWLDDSGGSIAEPLERRLTLLDAASMLSASFQDLWTWCAEGKMSCQARFDGQWVRPTPAQISAALKKPSFIEVVPGAVSWYLGNTGHPKPPMLEEIHFLESEVDRVLSALSKGKPLGSLGKAGNEAVRNSVQSQNTVGAKLPEIDLPGRKVSFQGKSFELSEDHLKCILVLVARYRSYIEGRVQSPDMHQSEVLKAAGLPASSTRLDQYFRRQKECFKSIFRATGKGMYRIECDTSLTLQ